MNMNGLKPSMLIDKKVTITLLLSEMPSTQEPRTFAEQKASKQLTQINIDFLIKAVRERAARARTVKCPPLKPWT